MALQLRATGFEALVVYFMSINVGVYLKLM